MHTQNIVASEDTWFLLPEYRKGWNAIKFLRFVEGEMTKRGAVEINMTAKMTNGAGRIMECLDYKAVSVQYSKQFGRAYSAQDSHLNAVRDDHVSTDTAHAICA